MYTYNPLNTRLHQRRTIARETRAMQLRARSSSRMKVICQLSSTICSNTTARKSLINSAALSLSLLGTSVLCSSWVSYRNMRSSEPWLALMGERYEETDFAMLGPSCRDHLIPVSWWELEGTGFISLVLQMRGKVFLRHKCEYALWSYYQPIRYIKEIKTDFKKIKLH